MMERSKNPFLKKIYIDFVKFKTCLTSTRIYNHPKEIMLDKIGGLTFNVNI